MNAHPQTWTEPWAFAFQRLWMCLWSWCFIRCRAEKKKHSGTQLETKLAQRCSSLIQAVSGVDPQVVSLTCCLGWLLPVALTALSGTPLPGSFQSGRPSSLHCYFSGLKVKVFAKGKDYDLQIINVLNIKTFLAMLEHFVHLDKIN